MPPRQLDPLTGAEAIIINDIAVLDILLDQAKTVVNEIQDKGGSAIAIFCNVLDKDIIESSVERIINEFGSIDILVNGSGENNSQATTSASQTFFTLPPDAIQWVFNLNFPGTFLPSQVFGKIMAENKKGVILNISMNAFRPLTRIPAYSAAKAAISNFTQWLAVHMAQEYSPEIRVNALAPGFFLTDQNRSLLRDKNSGNLTTRGKANIDHTPMGRFGVPEDLLGTVYWLISPASSFVTGVVIPIDGGFSSFYGV